MVSLTMTISSASTYKYQSHISNMSVTSITEDAQGFIWFGTKNGLNRFDGVGYRTFNASSIPFGLKNNYILDLCTDADGGLWIGCKTGIYYYKDGKFSLDDENTIYNPISHIFNLGKEHIVASGQDGLVKFGIHIEGNRKTPVFQAMYSMRDNNITNVMTSSNNDIWFTTLQGSKASLTILDSDMKVIQNIALNGVTEIYDIEGDINGSAWVATDRGIYAFDLISRHATWIPEEISSITDGNRIHFIRRYGKTTVLIGIQNMGLYVYDFYLHSMNRIRDDISLEESEILCFIDSKSNIWLSDGQTSPFCIITDSRYRHFNTEGDMVHLLAMDINKDGTMLMKSTKGYFLYDHIQQSTLTKVSYSGLYPSQLLDSQGNIWISNESSKLYKYSYGNRKLTLQGKWQLPNVITSIYEGNDGNLWIFTGNRHVNRVADGKISSEEGIFLPHGIYSEPVRDRNSGDIYINFYNGMTMKCSADSLVENCFSLNSVSCLTSAKDGTIWYGTYNKGLVRYNPADNSTYTYDVTNGLIDNDIKAIIEDIHGNIWFSSSRYITKYDKASGEFIVTYNNEMNPEDFYETGCACSDDKGNIYFGGHGGYTMIGYEDLMESPEEREVVFLIDEVSVNGQSIEPLEKSLVLNHTERNIQIRFVSLNYTHGSRVNYAYRLKGFDQNWIHTTENTVNYNNLAPGNYTFEVRRMKSTGEWEELTVTLPIKIRHSVFGTIAAKILYVIIFLSIGWMLLTLFIRNILQSERLDLKEKKEELQQEYIDYINNVSHEFRTPLSLIYGPLRQLSRKDRLEDADKDTIILMERNAKRLMELSEKILSASDSRISDKTLKVSEQCPQIFLKEIYSTFCYAAMEKDIKFTTAIANDPDSLLFDYEKVEKILYNILSNAFKFTPVHGKVELRFYCDVSGAHFAVSDNGPGIPEDKRNDIFTRFNRLGAEESGIQGSGIGLHYSQGLAYLHKGKITYERNEDQGATFILTIPRERNSYNETELTSSGTIIKQISRSDSPDENLSVKETNIILVEDNEDVRIYLKSLLSEEFNVITCSDGQEGIDKVRNIVPDMVISDIMMPHKDGYTLCHEIKTDSILCHIPVILLTAKTGMDSNMKGLKHGADAYMTKPFDPDHLIAVVHNILDNRKRIQKQIMNLTSDTIKDEETISKTGISRNDKIFLEKVLAVLDQNINKEKYTLELLSKDLGLSYSNLYGKLKALTGTSPLSFINNHRMNVAKEMLSSGIYSVSEVGYAVGFSTPSSFSRKFKKHFGKSPSDIMKDITQSNQ